VPGVPVKVTELPTHNVVVPVIVGLPETVNDELVVVHELLLV
jgi:hypothetical protein